MNRAIHTASRPVPGIQWGDCPELDEREGANVQRHASASVLPAWGGGLAGRVAAVRQQLETWKHLPLAGLLAQQPGVLQQLARDGLTADAAVRACAFVTHAARHTLGLAAFDGQLFATLAMLDNRLVEMATGEGKSLAAALAAAVGALAGIPVHVLTSNDYLVTRDAERFGPFFEALQLSVASVVEGQDRDVRRAAYAKAIVYVTAKELVFDYLRDRLLLGAGASNLRRRADALAAPAHPHAPQPHAAPSRPVLRGLCMAIVDEADSILIDEAQMPLVLSRQGNGVAQRAFLWQAHALSGQLTEDQDFLHLRAERRVVLTPAGKLRIEQLATRLQPVWKNQQHREENIATALTARHVFRRDRDYVVTDGEIEIVDAVTGRTAPGRKWSRGLHALVALKEGLQAEPELETLAQITYQRFFRRYIRFCGMSGTLREVRRELASVYRTQVVDVALHRPSQRQQYPTLLFADDQARWEAVVARTRELSGQGRPVLIACDSVGDSDELSAWLTACGIAHAVLNANFDATEAQIIASAGQAGRITVSTNMAGRGTDIHLDAQALAAGGLHVLCCQHNASRRHDRQLAGRAGRQGQPGSSEAWLSLESPRFDAGAASRAVAWCCRLFLRRPAADHEATYPGQVRLPGWLLKAWLTSSQRFEEARQARRRRARFRQDDEFERGLSFCGIQE
ncbi:hypothetical protein BH11PSE9_BH11PSE9_07090 [soil metagenome]